jgi:predicted TIM-barrel fold metal-dependent hydrolase
MTSTTLFDCDTHFTDHLPGLWAAAAHGQALPVSPEVIDVDGQTRLRLGDLVFPKPSGSGQGNPRGLGHLIGPGEDSDRAAFMADHGIAAAVLQPGFVGLSFHAVEDAGARTALAAACNAMAAESCARSSLALSWAVLMSAEDPDWSLAEVARYLTDPHVVGAVVRPTARTAAVRLHSTRLTPVLQALAAYGLTLFVHGGTGCHQWSPLADGYADYALTHAFGHMGEHMIALTDLLTRRDGLPEGLKVVLLESGVSWIPPLLERLALHQRRLGIDDASPMHVMREHIAVVPDPDERYALDACSKIGATNVLFGSDYPHWDTVSSADWLSMFGQLCPAGALRDNTAAFVPRLCASAGG